VSDTGELAEFGRHSAAKPAFPVEARNRAPVRWGCG
jgi:hypothetical protein